MRCVPAVIAWDGGPTGNGTNWHDPANWAGDVLPGPADDVTLGPTGFSPHIQLLASTSVRGVTNGRNLDIYGNDSGGSVTLTVGAGGLTNNRLAGIDLTSPFSMFGAGLAVVGGPLDNAGTLRVSPSGLGNDVRSVSLTGGAGFNNTGNLRVDASLTVSAASGSSVSNPGAVLITGGEFTIDGPFANLDPATNTLTGGNYTLLAGTLRVPGAIDTIATTFGLVGSGRVVNTLNGTDALANLSAVAPGGRFDVALANFTVAGALSNAGTVNVGQNGTFAASSFSNAGTVAVGGTLTAAGGFVNAAGGTLRGTGTVAAAVSGPGALSPGSPTNYVFAFGGNVTVVGGTSLGGPLVVELTGTTAGTQYDRLTVTGPVALGGPLTLNVSFAAPAGTQFIVIDNDGTDAVAGTFAGLPQGATVVANGQAFTVDYAGGTGNDVVLTRTAAPTAPPRVAGVAVNAGQANATQRSRVTTLTMTFDQTVTFAGPVAAAFDLTRIDGGAVGSFAATAATVNGVTVVTLSAFAGAETEFGSLADGRYALVVRASQVTNLDGDGNGTGGDDYTLNGSVANGLYRLYGDASGDGVVNAADFAQFRGAFGSAVGQATYLAFLDFDGDGSINAFDFGQLRNRFGGGVP